MAALWHLCSVSAGWFSSCYYTRSDVEGVPHWSDCTGEYCRYHQISDDLADHGHIRGSIGEDVQITIVLYETGWSDLGLEADHGPMLEAAVGWVSLEA